MEKINFKLFFIFFTLFFSLFGIRKADISDLNSNVIFEVNDKGNGMVVQAKLNKDFAIKILGNPTTGYSWYLKDTNENLLQCVNLNEYKSSKDYISNNNDPYFSGGDGYYYFRFKPISIGLVNLHFSYLRIWEKQPIRDIYIDVNIE